MKRITNLEKKYVLDVLNNEFSTSKNSIYNTKLERAFAEKYSVNYAIGHVNGTATMHTALASLNIGKDDEVIVPPLTMSSTSLAVLHNNSIPIFADVDKDTFTIDPEEIERSITKHTKAIITVALYGLAPNYDAIQKICKKHNLFLIEDNAECFYSEYKGKLLGQFGDFASYSFQASKHLTSGEGGMLLCNNSELANNARRFSSLGYAGVNATKGKITKDDIQDPEYSRHIAVGFNYRMSELQAAVILGQLERADQLVNNRIKVAKIYDEVLGNSDILIKQKIPDGYKHSFWAYSVYLNKDIPESEWYKFKEIYKGHNGDGFYAAWKLTYNEPLFRDEIQKDKRIWQKYTKELCPSAEFLQKRMMQFKTNYWNIKEAEKEAEAIYKTLKEF